eukprot:COSAG01_NODE_12_length_41732_cov_160.472964_6_plen_120_part_00
MLALVQALAGGAIAGLLVWQRPDGSACCAGPGAAPSSLALCVQRVAAGGVAAVSPVSLVSSVMTHRRSQPQHAGGSIPSCGLSRRQPNCPRVCGGSMQFSHEPWMVSAPSPTAATTRPE